MGEGKSIKWVRYGVLPFAFLLAGSLGVKEIHHRAELRAREHQELVFERDSLLKIIEVQDRRIKAQAEHFRDCAFISEERIKRRTNKYWLELKREWEE